MTRRDFLVLASGGVGAWPLAGATRPVMPVIGFLSSTSATETTFMDSFRKGLRESGYVETVNVTVEYRWAEGQYRLLPELARDLVHQDVALIVATGGTQSARAAKTATAKIPILFISGADPVQAGLVMSMNRPGGNATGVSVSNGALLGKRVELLRELLPSAATIAVLLNPTALGTAAEEKQVEQMKRENGEAVVLLKASPETDFDRALANAVQQHASGLVVSADPFFTSQRDRLVSAAAHHAMPAVYPWREYIAAGGLMSYGPSITEAYHRIGVYAGRILKGARPNDLPVEQANKLELTINLRAAHTLGLNLPRTLLARADELIE
jgi:putative tryptophan/tyrosine transport system substrate-binding protein